MGPRLFPRSQAAPHAPVFWRSSGAPSVPYARATGVAAAIGVAVWGWVSGARLQADELAASGVTVAPVEAQTEKEKETDLEEQLRALDSVLPGGIWDQSFALRSWAGYRSNPQLSSVNPVGSPFVAAGGEAMVFRLPTDGWEASVFAVLERLEYFEEGLPPETTGIVDARAKRSWESGWVLGLGLEYFYLKQVFDASEIIGVPVVIPTEGHTLGVRPMVGRSVGMRWRLEGEPEWARQWLAEPLDGFTDAGVRVQAIWKWAEGSEWAISYRFRDRMFDERPTRDASGNALGGTLQYRQHEWESVWRAAWGKARRWRSWLRAGYVLSTDNGGGFFDYDRFQVGGQVRWVGRVLEMRAEARGRWYAYPVQRAYEPDGPKRKRTGWTAEVRGDWRFHRRWRVFAQYEADFSDENLIAADYAALAVHGGFEVEL